MAAYIHFTDEQKARARQTDICALLQSRGETVKRSGSEFEWKDGSQKVTIRGNLWFHQYEQVGGDAIDFVKRFYNKNYQEAMEYLLGNCAGTLVTAPIIQRKAKNPFVLPPRNDNMRRIYAYLLNRRGIDREVLNTFVYKEMIYESSEYHNAVFIGYDTNGIPRHAHKRGSGSNSTYKGNQESSLPEYSFHWNGESGSASVLYKERGLNNLDKYPSSNQGKKLYLFEAPIDMLSFISMHKNGWKQHSYAAACGVSDIVLWQMLKDDPNIETICLCRDNDAKGRLSNTRTVNELIKKGIQYEILVPNRKDWNEDLLF